MKDALKRADMIGRIASVGQHDPEKGWPVMLTTKGRQGAAVGAYMECEKNANITAAMLNGANQRAEERDPATMDAMTEFFTTVKPKNKRGAILLQQYLCSVDPERAALFLEYMHSQDSLYSCLAFNADNIVDVCEQMADKGMLVRCKKLAEASDNLLNGLYLTRPDKSSDEPYGERQVMNHRLYNIMNMLATYGIADKDGREDDTLLREVEKTIERLLPDDYVEQYRVFYGRMLQRRFNADLGNITDI